MNAHSVLSAVPKDWLPAGKEAAICLTIDDVHPATSADCYEAGGDLEKGACRHLIWLLERHAELRATLFVTADWRITYHAPTRALLAGIPIVRDNVFLAPLQKAGRMRIDRHPRFVQFLKQLPRTEVGLHGLNHCHRGKLINVEFQNQSRQEIAAAFEEMVKIFRNAQLDFEPGMCPPGWNAPDALLEVMIENGMGFVASARDVITAISPEAVTDMSGMRGVSLIYPQWIKNNRLLHIPANFSPTTPVDRALEIIEHGGLVSVKAHIIKSFLGRPCIDGLDEGYRHYLDLLFTTLEARYGERLWWTSMGEICRRLQHKAHDSVLSAGARDSRP